MIDGRRYDQVIMDLLRVEFELQHVGHLEKLTL
jgi:hypothetical protein